MNNIFLARKFTLLSVGMISCLIFFPKITLFEFLNYRQGIRIEDLFVLFYGISLFLMYGSKLKIKFNLLYAIFIYLLFINTFSTIQNHKIEWIVNVRILEYIVISYGIYFSVKSDSLKPVFFSSYIYLNTLIALLQYFHLIGAFASFGYLESTHGWLLRPYGLTGGPWELGATVILATLCHQQLSNRKTYILMQFCALICVILAGTRANIIAFIIILAFLNYKNISLKLLFQLFLAIIAFSIFLPFLPYTLERIQLIHKIPFQDIYSADISLASYLTILGADPSLAERFRVWNESYFLWTSNWISLIFGIGWHNLYMESFILRIIFSFGLIGLAGLIYYLLVLDFYLIIFLLFCGLSLDLFVSMKIFCFFAIYLAIKKITGANETVPA